MAAPTIAVSPITLTATQASRNQALPRSTGIHTHAERQMRRIASAVVTNRSGAATMTHSLTSRLPGEAPSSSAVIAIVPAMRTGTLRRT